MLDLRRLRLLRELDERGTIAAVAEALQFTPSAISQQLALLERETGVKLLERAGRGVRLTDPALVLVEHAGRCCTRRRWPRPISPRPSSPSPVARASRASSRRRPGSPCPPSPSSRARRPTCA